MDTQVAPAAWCTVFGTSVDITLSELPMECFYPNDEPTMAALRCSALRAFSEGRSAVLRGLSNATGPQEAPTSASLRKDLRNVKRLRRNQPLPINAVIRQVIHEANLADPHTHLR